MVNKKTTTTNRKKKDLQLDSLSCLDQYSANIDYFDGGVFYGWAVNDNKIDESVYVELYSGQILLAQGFANEYREDLLKANMGNGKHGFSLPILELSKSDAKHSVNVICNREYLARMIQDFDFEYKSGAYAEIHRIDGVWLQGAFGTANSFRDGTLSFTVSIDGKLVGKGTAPTDGQKLSLFSYRIPSEFFDGGPHVILVALDAEESCQASTLEILRPISTPFSYLKGAKESQIRYFGGLSPLDIRRMTSYQGRLKELSDQENIKEIQIINNVYQAIFDGHKLKKDYEKIAFPKPPNSVDVSILIPVHNKFEYTYHCLASIFLQGNKCSYEIIIIDDCSTDQTKEIKNIIENVKVISNQENLGFLRSCNKAAKVAKGKYIVLLNNDTEVCFGWLDELFDVFKRFKKVGAVGAKLINADASLQEAGGIIWDNGQPWNLGRNENSFSPEWNYVRKCDYLSGAALMISAEAWRQVDGLSDEFAPCYYEDTDLAFKLREKGYSTLYCPHAEVIHFEGVSHGKDTSSGLKRFQLINAPKFASKWCGEFLNNGRMEKENIWRNKDRDIRYRCLVIDYATPEPNKNAGAYAAVEEMKLLQACGFKLTFMPENHAHFGKLTTNLQKLGIECIHAPFYISAEDFLQKRGKEYDLVYITRYDVAERHIDLVRKYTNAKLLFNNADLHFLRELRANLVQGKIDLSDALATRDRELGLMRKVDAILSYNEAEHAVITSHILVQDNIFKCPWVLNPHQPKISFEKRFGIAFLGGYKHNPNVEAVNFFVKEVMPLVRAKRKDIDFYIYGSDMPEEFTEFSVKDGIIAKGYVENLSEVYERHRIVVAPLLSGAGVKGKVLEAISWGVPTVLSPIAAEATGLSSGINTFIEESPEDWVGAILTLYDDEAKWKMLSSASMEIARNNYSFISGLKLISRPLKYLGFYSKPLNPSN